MAGGITFSPNRTANMSKPDYLDTVSEEELRVHAKQLQDAVVNLLFMIKEINEATGGATSRTEINEARQLVGLASVSSGQDNA